MKPNRVADFNSFILVDSRFFSLLSDSTFRRLDVLLYFKAYSDFRNNWDGKTTAILQVLTCFIKPLVDLIAFPHLGHIFSLNSIAIIALQWADVFGRNC